MDADLTSLARVRAVLEGMTVNANDPGWHERYRAGMLLVIHEVERVLDTIESEKDHPHSGSGHR